MVECEGCSLIAVEPTPAKDELVEIYDERFFQGYFAYLPYECDERLRKKNFARLLAAIERYKSRGRLLDVGCATGLFLEVLGGKWEAVGTDISRHACGIARRRTGCRVEFGELTEVEFPPKSFDAVTMWSVIEHARDPVGYLAQANRLLRDGGVLALTTGDVGSIFARLSGKRWRLLIPRMHLFYFSRYTMRRALERCGFRVLELSSVGKQISIAHLLYILYSVTGWEPIRRYAAAASSFSMVHVSFYASVGDVMLAIARKERDLEEEARRQGIGGAAFADG